MLITCLGLAAVAAVSTPTWHLVKCLALATASPVGALVPTAARAALRPLAGPVLWLWLWRLAASRALPDQFRTLCVWRRLLPIFFAYVWFQRRLDSQQGLDDEVRAAAAWPLGTARHGLSLAGGGGLGRLPPLLPRAEEAAAVGGAARVGRQAGARDDLRAGRLLHQVCAGGRHRGKGRPMCASARRGAAASQRGRPTGGAARRGAAAAGGLVRRGGADERALALPPPPGAQVLASKREFIPEQWCSRLAELWDSVAPRPWKQVKRWAQALAGGLWRAPGGCAGRPHQRG
jgi:hypothetical protein